MYGEHNPKSKEAEGAVVTGGPSSSEVAPYHATAIRVVELPESRRKKLFDGF